MKIERITKIKNYRIFHEFNWSADLPDFSRYNLIYGWNGSGKTTLSNLFTYLQKQQNISQCDIRFQIDGAVINGNKLSVSVIPQVRVFNRDTVSRSLFEVPNHELEPVFYLGEDSAEKQQEVEELKLERDNCNAEKKKWFDQVTKEKKDLDTFCKNKAAEIKALLTSTGGGAYNYYNKGDFSIKCDQFIAFEKTAYSLLPDVYDEYLSTKGGVALDKIAPIAINLPDYSILNTKVSKLLQKSVVSNVIAALADKPDVASWVQTGLAIHNIEEGVNTQCHFCMNEVPVERVKALESHFNDQLTAFQSEVDNLTLDLDRAIKSIETINLPSRALFYQCYQEGYKKGVSTWEVTKGMVTLYLSSLVKALQSKREQPFKEMDLNNYLLMSSSTEEKSILMQVLGFLVDGTQAISVALGMSALEKLNSIVEEHNTYTDNFKTEVEKSRRILETHTVSSYLNAYQNKKDIIISCENGVTSENNKLVAVETKIMILEREIKEFIKPVEELNAEMADYLGRDELKFEIKGNGYVITRNGHPAMNLSEGERTAIAFMYFLKTLKDTEFDMPNGVIVIDDPISSLDANSMFSAFGFMKDRTRTAKQLFVLTHSFTFFRHVRKWFFQEPKLPAIQGVQGSNDYRTAARFYMLDVVSVDGKRLASIKNIDPLLRDYESEYQYLFKKVHSFIGSNTSDNLESYYGLPNIARRLLESFLTFKMPHYSSNSFEKKLDEVGFDSAKKMRILRFLHVHSHYDQVGAPEHDLSLLAEAPAVLNDLMELIKTVDREHYNGMVSFSEAEV